jgi:hypothetical protein
MIHHSQAIAGTGARHAFLPLFPPMQIMLKTSCQSPDREDDSHGKKVLDAAPGHQRREAEAVTAAHDEESSSSSFLLLMMMSHLTVTFRGNQEISLISRFCAVACRNEC